MKKTEYLTCSIVDGIVYCDLEHNMSIDYDAAVKIIDQRLEFQKGIEYPLLIKLNNLKFATPQGREYMAKEGTRGIIAGAFLTNSTFERTILNLFLLINRPPKPARAFSDEKEALQWLKQFVKK